MLGSKEEKPDDSEKDMAQGMLAIAQQVEVSIDALATQIFAQFQQDLLANHITYIVPAIWGAAQDGDLTDIQKKINKITVPVVEKAVFRFDFREINPAQVFALGYILRSLIVTKIVYMIEASRRRMLENETDIYLPDESLRNVEPVGNA